MKRYSGIFLVALCVLVSCNNTSKKEEVVPLVTSDKNIGSVQFWNNLKAYCGNAYEGKVVSAPKHEDFYGKRLVMHVLSCENDFILIPFNVGENRSRTWVLQKKGNRIELKHDHRKEDGVDDEVTMYGGMTTNSGLPHIQVFPADEATKELIPEAATNIWWITLQNSTFTYNLKRMGSERTFSVAFDLTKSVETPKASWGWEEK